MKQSYVAMIADRVIRQSLQLEPGDRVLIDIAGEAETWGAALVEAAYRARAQPLIQTMPVSLLKATMRGCSREQMLLWSKQALYRLRSMNAYIGITADLNMFELTDIPEENQRLYYKYYYQPILAAFTGLPKWTLLHLPSYALAQSAQMSLDQLCGMFIRACGSVDAQFHRKAEPLARRLAQTGQVRIVAPDTDLTFSIRGQRHVLCDGSHNLPGGELFTSPLLDSVEGAISFNVPFQTAGKVFRGIRLVFRQGRVVHAECSDSAGFREQLALDEGASRIGEFGIGLNPGLRRPVGTSAFDEKMLGSIHLALGQCYETAGNGNQSTVHMDLVLSLAKADGGGALYFDGELVMKDGGFVPSGLQHLNQ